MINLKYTIHLGIHIVTISLQKLHCLSHSMNVVPGSKRRGEVSFMVPTGAQGLQLQFSFEAFGTNVAIINLGLCRNVHLNNICNLDILVKVMH